jgi:monoamine oxidase
MSRGVDVIVIGAGLAGLSAARTLVDRGASVLVLEARDRVGGRLYSRRIGGATFDVGGQWIGPGQSRVAALARRLGLETFPTHHDGKKVLHAAGRVSTYSGSIPTLPPLSLVQLELLLRVVDRMRASIDPKQPWAAKRAAALDSVSVDDWRRRWLVRADVSGCLDAAVRTVFGVEAREVGMLHFLSYCAAGGGLMRLVEIHGGAQQDRFVSGAQGLALGLAAELDDRVRLNAPVSSVTRDDGGVRVAFAGGEVVGSRVIVALSPLLAGSIHWSPPLPAPREHLHQRVPMGHTAKVLLLYERAVWRERGFSGELVSDAGPLSVVFDNGSHDGSTPALLGFAVGEPGRVWSALDERERRRAVIAQLARAFGSWLPEPVAIVEHDWTSENWTRGCPVGTIGTGVLTTIGHALREPVDRIHWAGTETAVEWTGYMEGAIESGERAAREVTAR